MKPQKKYRQQIGLVSPGTFTTSLTISLCTLREPFLALPISSSFPSSSSGASLVISSISFSFRSGTLFAPFIKLFEQQKEARLFGAFHKRYFCDIGGSVGTLGI